MNIKLTVFFEGPFWVGIFEKIDDGRFGTSKVVFGSEPKDYEVYFFVLENYYKLVFSKPIRVEMQEQKKINPKRLQRVVKNETLEKGIGTKAQQAMKLEHEVKKEERKKNSKEMREEIEKIKFEKHQGKKKEKKKGH